MAARKTRPGDLTARQVEEANKKRDEEQAARKEELSMASAAEKEIKENEIVDMSGEKPAAPKSGDDVEIEEVEVAQKFATIKVNEDIDMTFAGTAYKMEVGRQYKVPQHVADWLEEKGIVWH